MTKRHFLDHFLNPKSIALIGTVKEGWFFGGGVIIKDLLHFSYKGRIYPIHPSIKEVMGIKVFPNIKEVPDHIELAVIMTSYKYVSQLIRECGEKGVRSVVVVSDGFGELGNEGRRRQDELVEIAKSFKMRIIGPNTLGVFDNINGFTTIPYEKGYESIKKGPLSIISQTGMYGPQALPFDDYNFGINKIFDLGNMCDVSETDCLEYLEKDEDTKVISMYIENIKRGRDFIDVAKRVSQKKPILCLRSGRSADAAAAMASHTGSIVGDDMIYDGLFKQTRVIRVEEYEDLLDCAKGFIFQPLPKGNRLGIITLSGANSIMTIDDAQRYGLVLADISEESKKQLHKINPLLGKNPVDLGPATAVLGAEIFNFYTRCVDVFMQDNNIDSIFVVLYATNILRPEYYEDIFKAINRKNTKPIVVWSYGTAEKHNKDLASIAEGYTIPCYTTSLKAIRTLGYMAKYVDWINSRAWNE
ncbi:MAG: CoA-binding protein [Deltaproteobacteria bacterium]|nr:CoA-binding protein [Deltaproteobacteria bacterium]